MNTTSIEADPAVEVTQRRAAPWSYYTYCELLKLLRNPPTLIFGVGFPTFFFALFGSAFPASYALSILASYSAYAAFVVPFQSFSSSLAAERGLGWNKLLRTTPLSVTLYLGAKTITILLVGVISLVILFVFATATGKVSLDIGVWAQLFVAMVLGMIPFVFMGLCLGLLTSATAAQAISSVVFLLLSFTSGYFIPIFMLPTFMQKLAPYLPTYHLGQLSLNVIDKQAADSNPLWVHILWLAGYALAFVIIAIWAYRRDESRNFS